MNPRFLQSLVHSEKSSESTIWTSYRSQVVNEYLLGATLEDFNDHLIREFNRRVYNLGLSNLLILPYDGGFRLAGVYVSEVGVNNALVYQTDYLVYNNDYLVYQ